MKIEFQDRPNGPKNLLCEAELVFGPEDGPLHGLKLVGLSVWRLDAEKAKDGREYAVTLPARVWGEGADRRFYDFLRPADGEFENVRKFKTWVSNAYAQRA
jgi:hypothetical protein